MTPFEQLQAQKILSCYNNNQIANKNIDNVEKGRKAVPDGTLSKDGKWVKQGGEWVSIKKYSSGSEDNKTTGDINDKKDENGKIHKVREDLAKITDSKRKDKTDQRVGLIEKLIKLGFSPEEAKEKVGK